MDILDKILLFVRSFYWNCRLFPIKQALFMPITVGKGVYIKASKGSIIIDTQIRRGLLRLGRGGSEGLQQVDRTMLTIEHGGFLSLKGNINLSEGTSIRIDESGEMIIGENFFCNKNCRFTAKKNITFGNNCLVGWNVRVNDCDGHFIIDEDYNTKPYQKDIIISDHVWLASDVIIQKGTFIAKDCVVAQGSIVNGYFKDSKSLIGGVPAKQIKKIGGWQR